MKPIKTAINTTCRDKHGRLTLFQRPNLPIIVWAISYVLSKILPYGQLNFLAALIAFGALFTWAWLEIFEGDSYFRKILGMVIMISLLVSRL